MAIRALLIASAWLAGCAQDAAPSQGEIAAAEAKAKDAVADFQAALKSRLAAAIAEGGPASAIGACRTDAPRIAEEASASHGLSLRRTALKVRNPANAPDAWERSQLDAFAAALTAGEGEPDGPLAARELVETPDGPVLRYMAAIRTQPLCVTCHGANLAPDVAAEIARLYPDDQAVGFSVGELRGAFTVRIPMQSVATEG